MDRSPRLLIWASAFYALLAMLAWAFARWTGHPLTVLPEAEVQLGPATAGLCGIAGGLVLVGLSRGFTHATASGAALAEGLRSLLPPLRRGEAWWLALVSGVAEEALFRGALQPQLGLLLTALLFGGAHFVPRRPFAIWAAFAVLAGVLFGLLYQATGSLMAPIAAHVVVNGLNLYWLNPRRG
ncbi:MAG: CPBP family intramembrane metalloprotease [Myxococcales bacterium]|nr:CPBP family intramembrane metalloprotease [Myxococcales bacterium]